MKEQRCKICGTTNSENFYENCKGLCKKCRSTVKLFNIHDCTLSQLNLLQSIKKRTKAIHSFINKKRKELKNKKLFFEPRKISVRDTVKYNIVLLTDDQDNILETYDNAIIAAQKHNCALITIYKYIRKKMPLKNGSYLKYGEKKLQPIYNDTRVKSSEQEFFINSVIANHGDVYSFEKSVYEGSDKNVIITCKKHKCDIEVIASTLLRRTERNGGKKKNPVVGSCPMCREEYFEQIKNEMYRKFKAAHNNEYEYEGYVNVDKSFFAICKEHGKFPITAESHLKGNGKCPLCYSNKAFEKFIDGKRYYACEIHGDVPIGLYRSLNQGCPECATENLRINNNILFENAVHKRFDNNYNVIITNYNVILTCKKHGTTLTYSKKEIQQKYQTTYLCNDCLEEYRRSVADAARVNLLAKVKEILIKKYSNAYTFVDFIDNSNIDNCKVKLLNIHTGKEKITKADTIIKDMLAKTHRYILKNFMSYEEGKAKMRELGITGFREYQKWHKRTQQTDLPSNPLRYYKEKWISYCDFFGTNPNEKMSGGEKRIEKYLKRKNINFVWQKRFKDCRDKMPLPFDFYVPKYNLIIEFDGEQHYKETKKFGRESFEITQKHDIIKNKYCLDNNINLLRLTFDDLFHNVIEWALDNEISRIGAEMAIK